MRGAMTEPPANVPILVWGRDLANEPREWYRVRYYNGTYSSDVAGMYWYEIDDVAAWMPLPPPPEGEVTP
jgi:hypothetical protein